MSLVTAMLLYNQRAFSNVNDLVDQLDLMSTQLEQRGQQRYQLQKQLTEIKARQVEGRSKLSEIINSELFQIDYTERLVSGRYSELDDWHKWRQIEDYFKKLKEQFPQKNSSSTSDNISFDIENWTYRMVDTLDEIQKVNILLARAMNQSMSKQLAKILTVNILLVAIIFLLVIAFNYHSNKLVTRKKSKLYEELLAREESLVSSKKVLVNLMEDLSNEKNEALKLFGELESANEKLEIKNSDMQQFVYTISHDLKAPLVTIGGFTNTLYKQLESKLNEDQLHKFFRISENVKEMQNMLADLLEISKVLTRKLEKSAIDVEELIRTQINQLEGLIEESTASIKISQPILEIFGNSRLVGLCIANLISNAIKYRDNTRSPEIEIFTEMTDNGIRLNVRDNGIGIEPKDHQRIFKVFERLTERQGNGIGLAIVKAVMDKHEGTIKVDSTIGVGSTFSLTFPFASS
jgi:signal transduction histidine kinase